MTGKGFVAPFSFSWTDMFFYSRCKLHFGLFEGESLPQQPGGGGNGHSSSRSKGVLQYIL